MVCYNPLTMRDQCRKEGRVAVDDQNFLTPNVLAGIEEELRRFRQSAKASNAFLIGRNGQLIGQAGDSHTLDTTALAALTASNIAASKAIAELLGENEFSGVFHEGEQDHLHISLVGPEAILVVVFDGQTSMGLVRLRVRKTGQNLVRIMTETPAGSDADDAILSPFAEITEEDIDQLFR